jgi:hypothetical protein
VGSARTEAERALEKLEKRTQRWLESEPEWGLRARVLGPVDRALAGFDARVAELERLTREAILHPRSAGDFDSALEALAPVRELAPLFQRARVAQAFLAWRAGDARLEERRLVQALDLSPEGILSDAARESIPASDRAVFAARVRERITQVTRGCSVELEIYPAEASIWLDGFALGGRRRFELVRGKAYQAWVRADGYAPKELSLDCRRAGQWIESVRLERGRDRDERALARLRYLSEVSGVGSVVFAEAAGDRIGLFLYTPGAGLDAVPTEKPLTLASLSDTGAEDRLPIASDAFNDLVARHRAHPFKGGFQQSGEAGYEVSSIRTAVKPTPWYKRRGFWIVLGAVGAGVATALLVGGGSRGVQSSPGISGTVE